MLIKACGLISEARGNPAWLVVVMYPVNPSRNSRTLGTLEQPLDHLVDRNPFRFRAIIEQNTMSQRRVRQLPDILSGHMGSPLQKSTSFTAQHQELPCPCPCAPTGPLINEVRCPLLARPRSCRNPYGVAYNLLRNRHLANYIMKSENVFATEQWRYRSGRS